MISGSQLAKMKKKIPYIPYHNIYRVEAVDLSEAVDLWIANYAWKITILVKIVWN